VHAIIVLAVSAPFTILHLVANPDDAAITPLQHIAAAIGNYFGPWGVALVRIVEFPNAGLRSFSWPISVGLTIVGVFLGFAAYRVRNRGAQYALLGFWAVFTVVWFTVGFVQIADGLL
jgi:hypothetical protein